MQLFGTVKSMYNDHHWDLKNSCCCCQQVAFVQRSFMLQNFKMGTQKDGRCMQGVVFRRWSLAQVLLYCLTSCINVFLILRVGLDPSKQRGIYNHLIICYPCSPQTPRLTCFPLKVIKIGSVIGIWTSLLCNVWSIFYTYDNRVAGRPKNAACNKSDKK